MLLLNASPGSKGGGTVPNIAVTRIPFQGRVIKGNFSAPNFNENFDTEKGIISNKELKEHLLKLVESIEL